MTIHLTELDLMGMVIIGACIGTIMGMCIVAGVYAMIIKGWYKQ